MENKSGEKSVGECGGGSESVGKGSIRAGNHTTTGYVRFRRPALDLFLMGIDIFNPNPKLAGINPMLIRKTHEVPARKGATTTC